MALYIVGGIAAGALALAFWATWRLGAALREMTRAVAAKPVVVVDDRDRRSPYDLTTVEGRLDEPPRAPGQPGPPPAIAGRQPTPPDMQADYREEIDLAP